MTSMGSRLLKKFIKNPLLDVEKIKERQKDVGFFIENVLLREEIREKLKDIYDIERTREGGAERERETKRERERERRERNSKSERVTRRRIK